MKISMWNAKIAGLMLVVMVGMPVMAAEEHKGGAPVPNTPPADARPSSASEVKLDEQYEKLKAAVSGMPISGLNLVSPTKIDGQPEGGDRKIPVTQKDAMLKALETIENSRKALGNCEVKNDESARMFGLIVDDFMAWLNKVSTKDANGVQPQFDVRVLQAFYKGIHQYMKDKAEFFKDNAADFIKQDNEFRNGFDSLVKTYLPKDFDLKTLENSAPVVADDATALKERLEQINKSFADAKDGLEKRASDVKDGFCKLDAKPAPVTPGPNGVNGTPNASPSPSPVINPAPVNEPGADDEDGDGEGEGEGEGEGGGTGGGATDLKSEIDKIKADTAAAVQAATAPLNDALARLNGLGANQNPLLQNPELFRNRDAEDVLRLAQGLQPDGARTGGDRNSTPASPPTIAPQLGSPQSPQQQPLQQPPFDPSQMGMNQEPRPLTPGVQPPQLPPQPTLLQALQPSPAPTPVEKTDKDSIVSKYLTPMYNMMQQMAMGMYNGAGNMYNRAVGNSPYGQSVGRLATGIASRIRGAQRGGGQGPANLAARTQTMPSRLNRTVR